MDEILDDFEVAGCVGSCSGCGAGTVLEAIGDGPALGRADAGAGAAAMSLYKLVKESMSQKASSAPVVFLLQAPPLLLFEFFPECSYADRNAREYGQGKRKKTPRHVVRSMGNRPKSAVGESTWY